MARQELMKRIVELKAQKKLLLEYTQIKIKEEDYHGGIDSLMDVRDIDAEVKGIHYRIESEVNRPAIKGRELVHDLKTSE